MEFIKFMEEFRWFVSLGGVIVVSTIITILCVKALRVTLLKKALENAESTQKDSILGLAGTLTSLVVYAIVYFATEMAIQGKFLIDFQEAMAAVSIPTGAAVTWVSAKGIYTVIHKWWQRVKSGGSVESTELKSDLQGVKAAIESEKISPTTLKTQIGKVKSKKTTSDEEPPSNIKKIC